MRSVGIFLVGFFVSWAMQGQDSLAVKYASTITAEELKDHLMTLASDEFEGRDTGSEGQKKAAQYISDVFRSYDLPPVVDGSYYQSFPLAKNYINGSEIQLDGVQFEFKKDYFFFPGFKGGSMKIEEWIFAGYGIQEGDYNDYKNLDVKGKGVIILQGEPMINGKSLLTGTDKRSDWTGNVGMKRDLADSLGAAMMMVVHNDFNTYLGRVRYWLETPRLVLDRGSEKEYALPVVYINKKLANAMLKKTKGKNLAKLEKKMDKKPGESSFEFNKDIAFSTDFSKDDITSENVLGYIEGSSKPEEVVIITAHFDHVGRKGDDIYNGADDDGSGTVTALEIAEAFSLAKKDGNGPARSVLIMTVSGEEKGLLGSEWYADHPVFPLENTVADLNIDMIGRVDEKHADDPGYIYLIGSDRLSTELHEISETANSTYTDLELDYTYNDPNDPNRFYYRSDHYNFAKYGIPVIFYFSGVHEDYHQPTDTPDKIMYDKMVPIAQLIFHTAWELANRPEKIVVDVAQEPAEIK